MVQVTNVTVFYGRSRQPAKYESAEAKIEFTASLSDGVGPNADHIAAAQKLLGEAKTIVLTELNLVAVGESASAVCGLLPKPPLRRLKPLLRRNPRSLRR